MNKIWLIMKREFLNRVQKKSFLIATILLPLIFPLLMAILVYVAIEQKKHASKDVVYYVDDSNRFLPDTAKYIFRKFPGPIDEAKKAFQQDESHGLLYIPNFDISNPQGITLYTKVNPSPNELGDLEGMLEDQVKELKMVKFSISQKILDSIKTDISIRTINISEDRNL